MTGGLIGLALGVGVVLVGRSVMWEPKSTGERSRRSRPRRSAAHRRTLRQAWPDAVDTLASGVRAGLSLPEAVAAVGTSGPDALRPAFTDFALDYRACGSFRDALERLREHLRDPVADRVVAALLLACEVGATELGVVLRTLSQMLREEARLRAEVEARQSWTVAAARMAVAAPAVTALLLSTRPGVGTAYASPAGIAVLGSAGALSIAAYLLMRRIARLPGEEGAG